MSRERQKRYTCECAQVMPSSYTYCNHCNFLYRCCNSEKSASTEACHCILHLWIDGLVLNNTSQYGGIGVWFSDSNDFNYGETVYGGGKTSGPFNNFVDLYAALKALEIANTICKIHPPEVGILIHVSSKFTILNAVDFVERHRYFGFRSSKGTDYCYSDLLRQIDEQSLRLEATGLSVGYQYCHSSFNEDSQKLALKAAKWKPERVPKSQSEDRKRKRN